MTTTNGIQFTPFGSFVLYHNVVRQIGKTTTMIQQEQESDDLTATRGTVVKKKKFEAANCSYSFWTTTTNGSNNNGNENVSGGIYKYKYLMYYWYQTVMYSFHRYAIDDKKMYNSRRINITTNRRTENNNDSIKC